MLFSKASGICLLLAFLFSAHLGLPVNSATTQGSNETTTQGSTHVEATTQGASTAEATTQGSNEATTQGSTHVEATTQGASTAEATTQGSNEATTQGSTHVEATTQGASTAEATTQGSNEATTQGSTHVEATTQGASTAEATTQGSNEATTQGPTHVEATTQGAPTVEVTTQGSNDATTQGPTHVEATTQGAPTVEVTTQGSKTIETTTHGSIEATTQRPTASEATTQGPTNVEVTTQGAPTVETTQGYITNEATTDGSETIEATTQSPPTTEATKDTATTTPADATTETPIEAADMRLNEVNETEFLEPEYQDNFRSIIAEAASSYCEVKKVCKNTSTFEGGVALYRPSGGRLFKVLFEYQPQAGNTAAGQTEEATTSPPQSINKEDVTIVETSQDPEGVRVQFYIAKGDVPILDRYGLDDMLIEKQDFLEERLNITITIFTKPTEAPSTEPTTEAPSDDDLPGWAIALIVIGCVIVVAIIAFIIYKCACKKKDSSGEYLENISPHYGTLPHESDKLFPRQSAEPSANSTPMYDNPVYDRTSGMVQTDGDAHSTFKQPDSSKMLTRL